AASLAGPFNDTLTAISGYCDLASSRLDRSDPVRHVVAEIQQAGDRAAMLTGRLLAHAEREVPVPQVLELDAWLTSHVTTLRSLVGDHLRLEVHPDAEGVAIRVDPHLLEQVLSDLIANARQAMGEEGALRLATSRIELDPDLAALLGAGCAGPHGVLSIHDSGGGMEERILPKIFEPFFTTKPGALGLGLTTVDRLVRSQGGHVRVESRWGEGSTFHVHFPLVESPGKAAADAPSSGEMPEPGPRRRVLLVEDDAVVRDLVREVLEMLHFHVLEARSGTEGLEIAEARTEPLDLLISDIVLPGITGDTLARRIRARQPHLPVLLMSGCSDGDLLARALEDETTAFLPKPFAPEALRAKIRDVLGPAVSTARSEADQADQADEVENAPVAPIHLGRSDDLEGDFDEGIETLEHIEAGGGA
ncbi:MAG: response regulator, partial [Planctomycetota bacterium]